MLRKNEKKIITPNFTAGQRAEANSLKAFKDGFKQESGETACEYGGKFISELNKAVDGARKKGIKGKIYIQILERPTLFGQNSLHHTFIVRRSRPIPEQSMYLYSHNDGDLNPIFEYCLPELQFLPQIWMNKHKFPQRYLENIEKWLKKELV